MPGAVRQAGRRAASSGGALLPTVCLLFVTAQQARDNLRDGEQERDDD